MNKWALLRELGNAARAYNAQRGDLDYAWPRGQCKQEALISVLCDAAAHDTHPMRQRWVTRLLAAERAWAIRKV